MNSIAKMNFAAFIKLKLNAAVTDQKTWFSFTDSFWDDEGPVFFYTGNEGSITNFWDNSGFVFEAAEKFNALVIFGEHVSLYIKVSSESIEKVNQRQ